MRKCNGHSQSVYFYWCRIENTENSLQRYTAATEYTSNMAAVTVVDRTTSLLLNAF